MSEERGNWHMYLDFYLKLRLHYGRIFRFGEVEMSASEACL